jgi:hypothetical protein
MIGIIKALTVLFIIGFMLINTMITIGNLPY